ncbi:hypothetical protein BX616_000984 [Lobosporangium transversale]|uniref:Peptidase M48 domain-containing protein n=1 Tax=Lobosporangium transversale TaxID=64571 RepID=A0A1Y2H004_9FUNG|nr:hypothetical protein BCR41DRAFT_367437 [Lobosporangium transversale]KAF9905561.1 hypothetical protein BX616_000984 [Lobosporangium transversale]ORZ27887.1 hypothetical protein BCR41DRAFT_367437 [Lobosporangium transversale]|eukprot:XP_021885590.1 hypothetical protein BCR41DRAFT_367437 [Lobosporangium transversale]
MLVSASPSRLVVVEPILAPASVHSRYFHRCLSRSFHSSVRSNFSAQSVPEALTLFKTAEGANALIALSMASSTLYFLPYKKWFQKSTWSRRLFVSFPIFLIILLLVVVVERAPNTGRWRFFLTYSQGSQEGGKEQKNENNEEKYKEKWDEDGKKSEEKLQEEAFNAAFGDQLIKDPNDERVKLVEHIFKNLVEGAIHEDGVTLKSFLCDLREIEAPKGYERAGSAKVECCEYNGENNTKTIIITSDGSSPDLADPKSDTITEPEGRHQKKPRDAIRINVSKDGEPNAVTLPNRRIIVYDGLLKMVNYNEDLVAAVIAHELAHVIQDHIQESKGQQTLSHILSMGVFGVIWAKLKCLGPFATNLVGNLLPTAFNSALIANHWRQGIEREADMVALRIMACAGYDPIHLARFFDILARLEEYKLLQYSEQEGLFYPSRDWRVATRHMAFPVSINADAMSDGRIALPTDGLWQPDCFPIIGFGDLHERLWDHSSFSPSAWDSIAAAVIQEGVEHKDFSLFLSTSSLSMEEQNKVLKEHAESRWWESTHPGPRNRQQYLTKAMYDVREKFRKSEKLRVAPIMRFFSKEWDQRQKHIIAAMSIDCKREENRD